MKKMKKIITVLMTLSAILLPMQGFADDLKDPDKKWTVPAIYAMDEEVTWYFDFSSESNLSEGEDLYMWIWAPVNPTNEPIPIKYEGDKLWSITLTPTEFFKMSATEILENKESNFFFLLRNLDASKLTGTLSFPKADFKKDFIESEKIYDYAPTDFTLDGTLTILFNSNLVKDFNVVNSTVHMHGGLNDWDVKQEFHAAQPEIREKTKFKDMGNGIYKKDIVPQTYFGVGEDYEMENVVFLAVKYNGNDADPGWAATSPDHKIMAPNVPIPPDPVFSYFPQKFSQLDILTLIRKNNEKGSKGLVYTITGGGKTLTGEFSGPKTEMKAFINLFGTYGSDSNLDKINLHVVDKNGAEIIKTDIPLVPLSEIE